MIQSNKNLGNTLFNVNPSLLREYQNIPAIEITLGALAKYPRLLATVKLTNDDFLEKLHKLVFSVITNLTNLANINNPNDLNNYTIDEYEIEMYCKQYPTSENLFSEKKGLQQVSAWIALATKNDTYTESTVKEILKANVEEIRKWSLLRSLLKRNVDVSYFYNPYEEDVDVIEERRERFEATSCEDMLNYYRNNIISLYSGFSSSSDRDSRKAGGEDAHIQKERFKELPSIGLEYGSNLFTTVVNGVQRRRFGVLSASSGTGKTRNTIGNICRSFTKEYYDPKDKKWRKNPQYSGEGCIYIGTEMELLDEIEPILWAYVSAVPQQRIMKGKYINREEEKRVDRAIDIIHESNIWLEYVPDYDIELLKRTIEKHLNHNIRSVYFDYIHATAELQSEFQELSGMKIAREDQTLANLSTKLKQICRDYNISLDTWTQVNGEAKNENNRDASVIRGAKAIADKADYAGVFSRITPKEYKLLEPIRKRLVGIPEPNVCISIYKNRGNEYNMVKIWLYIDYDTMRVHDCFCTDYDYCLIDIKPTYIVVKKDDENTRIEYSNDKKTALDYARQQLKALNLDEDDEEINSSVNYDEEFKELEERDNARKVFSNPELLGDGPEPLEDDGEDLFAESDPLEELGNLIDNIDNDAEEVKEEKPKQKRQRKKKESSSDELPKEPKKRGRPKGSKNKETIKENNGQLKIEDAQPEIAEEKQPLKQNAEQEIKEEQEEDFDY